VATNSGGRARPWITAAKIAATAAVLVLLLSRIDPGRTLALWGRLRPGPALVAIALLAPNLACQYGRWRVGLRRAHPRARPTEAFRALLIGTAMAAVTPGSVGEFGQVMFLSPGGRRPMLGVLAISRLYVFFVAVAIGVGMWIYLPWLLRVSFETACAAGAAILAGMIAYVAAGEWFLRAPDRPFVARFVRRVPGLAPAFEGVKAVRVSDRARFMGWSLALELVFQTQLVWLARAFGAEVAWLPGIAAGAVATGIVSLLPPVTLGSVGVRESAAVVVWHQLGVAAPVAFNAAFSLFLLNVAVPGVVGLAWNAARAESAEGEEAAP